MSAPSPRLPRPGEGKRSIDLSTRTKLPNGVHSPAQKRKESILNKVSELAAAGASEDEFAKFDAERMEREIYDENALELDDIRVEDIKIKRLSTPQPRRPTVFSSNFTRASVKLSPWKEDPSKATSLKKASKLEYEVCAQCNSGPQTYLSVAKNNHTLCLNALKLQDRDKLRGAPSIHIRDQHGASAMHYAARSGNLDMIQWLIENKISILTPARNGSLPAHDAAATGNLNCLQCFLFYDRNISQSRLVENGFLPLHLACMFGRVEVVAWLLEEGLNTVDEPTENGTTPLHYAAHGHKDLVSYLLPLLGEQQLNARNKLGVTPFFKACEDGNLDCATLLAEAGAKISLSVNGLLPIHIAAKNGHTAIVKYLITQAPQLFFATTDDGASLCHFAAVGGKIECLKYLLEYREGVSPSSAMFVWTDNFGHTPVHDAAEVGHLEVIKLLATYGFNLAVKDMDGLTPADIARTAGETECAIFLTLKAQS